MKYRIANHIIEIDLRNTLTTVKALRSFMPFAIDTHDEPMMRMTVDESLLPYPKEELRLIRDVDTGNGVISVLRHTVGGEDVGYEFQIRDIFGNASALLLADNDFRDCQCSLRGDGIRRAYGLNSVIMLCYAFATARYDTVLVHASMVRHDGRAYAFIAKSGTGKSTQVSNWLRNVPDCDLMNDDNPIFRIEDGRVIAYGSPWSGKTPCYRQVCAPLGGVAKIVRDEKNFLERLQPIEAFTELLMSCSLMKWDVGLYKSISAAVSRIVAKVPIYNLHCLPNADSAFVASEGMR